MIRMLSGHHPAANPSLLLPLCPAAGQRGRGGEGLAEAQLPHIFQDGVSPFAPGPAKVTARSAGGQSLAATCYWRHNLRRSSLHWTKRWTGLNLTLRVNDRYPKFWYFVKRPYWWISALGLKCKVWKFGTNWAKSEEVIAKKQGLTGSEIHSRCLTQVMGGVSLHVRTCTSRFCISGTVWPIVFKFGMWVGGSLSTCFPQVMDGVEHHCTCARAPHPPISVSQDPIDQFC